MSRRQLLLTVLLAVIGEITLLGVVVFLAEPQRVGGQVLRFHSVDVAYLAVPLMLMAAAAVRVLLALFGRRRREA